MKVNEIFVSCQGEGPDAGIPAVFVRLAGCNVSCRWCDTKYASLGTEMPVGAITDKVKQLTKDVSIKTIIVTGGEPLLQEKELCTLIQYLYEDFGFVFETNGTIAPPRWYKSVLWDVDRKCPSSGVYEFNLAWCHMIESRIKFVVADVNDLNFVAEEIAKPHFQRSLSRVLVSPMIPVQSETVVDPAMFYGWPQQVWGFCVANNLRFSFQLHKIIWGNKRGV